MRLYQNLLRMLMLNKLTIRDFPAIHGFYTRQGGKSKGIYQGLNCGIGSKDDAETVALNRELVRIDMGANHLVSLYQYHSNKAVIIDEDTDLTTRLQADGMATKLPNISLGILTADCAPILFIDPIARVIGAAHAGWKGALYGVVADTLDKMQELGAKYSQIHAAIGALITQESYEVGAEFTENFMNEGNYAEFFIAKNNNKYQFNLPQFLINQINKFPIASVHWLGMDTYSRPDLFFSNRYAVHHQYGDYGRLISCIRLDHAPL